AEKHPATLRWHVLSLQGRRRSAPFQPAAGRFRRDQRFLKRLIRLNRFLHENQCPLRSITLYSLRIGFSIRSNDHITTPGKAAMTGSIMKKWPLSIVLKKLPRKPPIKLPTKFVASQSPISIDTRRAGAILVTSDNPTGEM